MIGLSTGNPFYIAVAAVLLMLIAHRPALAALGAVAQDGARGERDAFDPVMRLWSEVGWAFQASELISLGELVTVFVLDAGSSKTVVADVIRPCLTRSALLGQSDSHVIAICQTSTPAAAQVIVRRVAAALERGAAGLSMGSRTARLEDVSEMLTHALSDLGA